MKFINIFIFMIFAIKSVVYGQVGYGTNLPSPSSVLDLFADNKALLIPRVNLIGVNNNAPISSLPPNALTAFNLTDGNGLTSGFYYYSTPYNKWIKFGNRTWNLLGNTNINKDFDFIGTLDDTDLVFKRNNVPSGLINFSLKNTAFGVGTLNLITNTTGANNVAVGFESLKNNTTGTNNVSVGSQSLSLNQTGSNNIAYGYQALSKNISGSRNVAIGASSLASNNAGSDNIANGYRALYKNTNGSFNLGIGYHSLYHNTIGNSNIAIGVSSLYSNTSGINNIAIGVSSLYNNDIGYNNLAIGNSSLFENNGNENVASGSFSLFSNITGNGNTAYGYRSLYNSTGSYNTAFGAEAGSNLISGDNNTAFGANTNFASPNADNQLNIANIIFGTNVGMPTGRIGIATAAPNSTLQVAGSISAKIRIIKASGDATIEDDDHTLLLEYDAFLPDPSPNNLGRVYYIINFTNNPHNVNADPAMQFIRDNGVDFSDYLLNTTIGNKGITVQSTGKKWVIINKY